MKKGNAWALLPIGIFVALYLGLGITFEYILNIKMGFYSIPIVVIFLIAIFVACLQNRKVSFDQKLTIMGQGIGDKNIITMILIFLLAGTFVGVVGNTGANSVAHFMLSIGMRAVYCQLLCFYSHGNLGRNDNYACSDSSCDWNCIGIFSATLHRYGNGRSYVWRQPLVRI